MMPLFLGWRCSRALLKLNTATTAATATSLLNLIRHNSSFPSSQHHDHDHDHDHGVSSTPASTEKCYCPNNLNGRILILAKKENEKEHFFYSAEIHEGGNVGPATLVATVPLKRDISLCDRCNIPQLVNGLLCFRDCNDIVIFNPSTGHFFSLPPQHHTSTRLTGFTFADNLSNQFKVLNIDLERDSNLREWALKQRERVPCSIYSFGDGDGNGNDVNNNWRPIQPQIPGDDHSDTLAFLDVNRNCSDITSVSVNGAMHWNVGLFDTKSPQPVRDFYDNPKRNIMTFDPQEESFKLIPLPADDKGKPIHGSLSVSCGRLCTQQNYSDKIDLWILEDYHNHNWVKQTFNFPFALNPDCAFRAINTNTGEVLLEIKEPKVSLLYYHKETGIFKRLEIEGLPQWVAELPCFGYVFGSFPRRVLLIDDFFTFL
ncbi:hypothetical protein CMV_012262 [Castanea mollissima]|uniref:F-box associated beta-propeller type 3 domain-containing protein n=1 Tax=Castanea mollissima TaxID=60419 RepID=A0A8J4VW90_9ROSI|nr:hypothetical protein CMV_012262 [Castanea mollissima]